MWIKRIAEGKWRIANEGFYADVSCPDGQFNHIAGGDKQYYVNGVEYFLEKRLKEEK